MENTTTIRVKKASYNTMKLIAKEKKMTMQDILDEAIKDYKKKEFFNNLNTAYAALKTNPKVSREEQKEQEVWDNTLLDGVDD